MEELRALFSPSESSRTSSWHSRRFVISNCQRLGKVSVVQEPATASFCPSHLTTTFCSPLLSDNYGLVSKVNRIRDEFSQTTHELKSKLEAALEKSISSRDAADQARFDLAEAKDKIKELDSRLILQQRSLDGKSSLLFEAQTTATESREALKNLRSEIDKVLVQLGFIETGLAVKEKE